MSANLLVVFAFASLFGLMALRVPIGVAMGIVGTVGFALAVDVQPALQLLAQVPIRTVTNEGLGLLPMFILMGYFATGSGLSKELFDSAHKWLGGLRGGLGAATILASAGFGAICGSSVAAAATMSRVALPEMQRHGYADTVSTGTVAAGGTLSIVIPPSVALALYGIIVQQDIGRLFIAGIVPGVLAIVLYLIALRYLAWRNPDGVPGGKKFPLLTRIESLRGVWAIIVLFMFVIGGMYGGYFTPTEAAAMGAVGTAVIGVLRRKLPVRDIGRHLVSAAATSASLFVIIIGAVIFGYFLAVTQVPQSLASFAIGLGLGPTGTLVLILLTYFVLGCFLDSLAMIVLTVPIVYPLMMQLGFDPIWFGVILVVVVEIALITPPIGMNVFVIKNAAPSIALGTIFRGALPFVVVDVVRVVLLCAFPALVLFLPSLM